GDVPITLDRANAPCAVNSFISLAEQGFYDDTPCHRLGVATGFSMLQCGDPTGTGAGGPGYQYSEELTGNETYPAGTLAMARTSAPGSQGSQFFLVFDDTQLSPDYTVFGTIDATGIAVLKQVAAAGTDNSEGEGVEHPAKPVTITAVTPR
ncbi:MAG TPA: peptidylprolyl isomerase, partial [Propionibacteriaceae bacterium]|nr:peptidylprolyl isomerase [Propionibacteriaceae bacterium]